MLKVIANLAEEKWEVNEGIFVPWFVCNSSYSTALFCFSDVSTSVSQSCTSTACLSDTKETPVFSALRAGCCPSHILVSLAKPDAQDQVWSTNAVSKNHADEASERSTYLPKEVQLSLPVFTRRGVGGL